MVFADTIVIDSEGNYICHRPSLTPQKSSMWARFPVLTSGIFLRRSVVHERGISFDTKWRDLGDFWWIREFVLQGVRIAVLPELTSVFTDTGDNMNLKPNAMRERREKQQVTPRWITLLHPFWAVQHRIRLATRSGTRKQPFDYSIYTLSSPTRRITFRADRPTTFWKGRLTLRTVTTTV